MDQDLDLSLFVLPIEPGGVLAEVPVVARNNQAEHAKKGFWGLLARRYDLTGPGSLVTRRRKPAIDTGEYANVELAERLIDAIETRDDGMLVARAEADPRPNALAGRAGMDLEEVSPQFSLRNVSRVERDVDVRRPSYQFAVWREPVEDDFEDVRKAKLEPPEFLEDFSTAWMVRYAEAFRDSVLGFAWKEELSHFPPVRRPPGLSAYHPVRISVYDLTLAAAPPMRDSWVKQHKTVMKHLSKRYDGTLE